jgi:thiamine transporter
VRNERTTTLVEMALAIALAAVLNALKIWRMPNAGTVSFVMLPIVIMALRRGLLIGLITGALYGVIDFFVDPFPPVHWAQPLLDYPIAFAMVGFAGLFALAWQRARDEGQPMRGAMLIVLACIVGAFGRYLVHSASGVLFFAEYAPAGQPVLIYSLVYNLYVPVSAVLTVVAALLVLPALDRAAPHRTAAL